MIKKAITVFGFGVIAIMPTNAFSQESEFDRLSQIKKPSVIFPLDYKIIRPRLGHPDWVNDFDKFSADLTPALRKTQASLTGEYQGVITSWTPNSILPHAQLDTNTITDGKQIIGTWQLLTRRSLRYNDSVDIPKRKYYRLADFLLDERTEDDVFAVVSEDQFKVYVRLAGKKEFKREMSAKYLLENRRFIMQYKLSKAAAGVSQIGIDENGYMILNYPKVIKHVKRGEYFSCYTIIEQYIYQKVKD